RSGARRHSRPRRIGGTRRAGHGARLAPAIRPIVRKGRIVAIRARGSRVLPPTGSAALLWRTKKGGLRMKRVTILMAALVLFASTAANAGTKEEDAIKARVAEF